MNITSCEHRTSIGSLHIIWCTRYHQIVGDTMPQLCVGCQNSKELREIFDNKSKSFEVCTDQALTTGICPIFQIPITPKLCSSCKDDIEVRADLALDARILRLKNHSDGQTTKVESIFQALNGSLAKLKEMVSKKGLAEAQVELRILEDFIDDFIRSKS